MPKFVWVRDKTTGHAMDVSEEYLEAFKEQFEVVAGYPVNEGHRAIAREPKFNTDKAGNPRGGVAGNKEA